MGYLSHRVDRQEIKPGDHIYTWRPAFTYSHHGIYVGENKVVHFTSPETANSGSGWNLSSSFPSTCLNSIDSGLSQPKSADDSGSGSNLSSGFPYSCLNSADCDLGSDLGTYECGFQKSESGVMVSCLNFFIGTGSLYLCQYGTSLCAYLTKIRGGTCTMALSDPPEDVMYRALYLLQSGFGDYHVVKNNCEDFALYCKTGLLVSNKATTGSSGQVNFMVNVPWETIFAVPKLVSTRSWRTVLAVPKLVGSSSLGAVTGVVAGAVIVGKYFWNRCATDIGVRSDVVKVKVEYVALFRETQFTGIEA